MLWVSWISFFFVKMYFNVTRWFVWIRKNSFSLQGKCPDMDFFWSLLLSKCRYSCWIREGGDHKNSSFFTPCLCSPNTKEHRLKIIPSETSETMDASLLNYMPSALSCFPCLRALPVFAPLRLTHLRVFASYVPWSLRALITHLVRLICVPYSRAFKCNKASY